MPPGAMFRVSKTAKVKKKRYIYLRLINKYVLKRMIFTCYEYAIRVAYSYVHCLDTTKLKF